jgi:hypothetical protein
MDSAVEAAPWQFLLERLARARMDWEYRLSESGSVLSDFPHRGFKEGWSVTQLSVVTDQSDAPTLPDPIPL